MWPSSVKMPRPLAILMGVLSFVLSILPTSPGEAILPLLIAAAIVGGSTLLSGIISSIANNSAATIQAGAAQSGIDESRRQFDVMQKTLEPYTKGGAAAFSAQGDLAGINGPEAQATALAALQNGPEMAAGIQQGENAMLQNASATGGLRGGNLQGALAQFRPQMLSQLISQQYGRLGGMATLGQNAAAGVATGALQTGTNITNLYGQQGTARAGGALATGAGWNSIPNALTSTIGTYYGLGGTF